MQVRTLSAEAAPSPLTERTVGMKTVFAGRALTVDLLDIALPDGRPSTREIVRHRGAVAVLARRPDGTFVFVRQYRKAIEQELLEVVAGSLEPGEDPLVSAHRELAEESGYRARRMQALGRIVACPGYSEEVLHLYFAELEQAPGATAMDHDENVVTVEMTEAEVEQAIEQGRLWDAKSLCCWLRWRMTRRAGV